MAKKHAYNPMDPRSDCKMVDSVALDSTFWKAAFVSPRTGAAIYALYQGDEFQMCSRKDHEPNDVWCQMVLYHQTADEAMLAILEMAR